MSRGRKPKPTALKILQGNPGKRPLPRNEPKPHGKAEQPDWLTAGGRSVWEQYAPVVEGMGLLTDADADVFGRWCELAAEFRDKLVDMSAAKMARMDKLESRFGLDPVSRASLGMAAMKAEKKNPFGNLAAG